MIGRKIVILARGPSAMASSKAVALVLAAAHASSSLCSTRVSFDQSLLWSAVNLSRGGLIIYCIYARETMLSRTQSHGTR